MVQRLSSPASLLALVPCQPCLTCMQSRALHLQALHGQKRCSQLSASCTPAGHCMCRVGGWGPSRGTACCSSVQPMPRQD